MLNSVEERQYSLKYNVRRCAKCCGNCKHFQRAYSESGCKHPNQIEFDSYEKYRKETLGKDYDGEDYGAYTGITVDEGHVCDLHEFSENAEK